MPRNLPGHGVGALASAYHICLEFYLQIGPRVLQTEIQLHAQSYVMLKFLSLMSAREARSGLNLEDQSRETKAPQGFFPFPSDTNHQYKVT